MSMADVAEFGKMFNRVERGIRRDKARLRAEANGLPTALHEDEVSFYEDEDSFSPPDIATSASFEDFGDEPQNNQQLYYQTSLPRPLFRRCGRSSSPR